MPNEPDDRGAGTPKLLADLEGTGVQTVSAGIALGARTALAEEPPLAFERYRDEGELGRGGMGEVRLCMDHRIGRRVALKMLRAGEGSRSGSGPRFLREARVQGRLEHPVVVPIYDLGVAPDGRPFFTMKRIAGNTLERVLTESASGNAGLSERWTQRRLLNAFAQVCQAVHYAHERGVIHRDLKPSNIMLGDFGEVYVLDWGVAKVIGDEPFDEAEIVMPSEPTTLPDALGPTLGGDGSSQPTGVGEVLGTPGYMAPEQIDGVSSKVGFAADIYALGAILFEILALQPLHLRSSLAHVFGSTIAGVDLPKRLRECGRDASPELVAICVTATSLQPDDRHADVRALLAPLERFLEGDRDLELRRRFAGAATDEAELAAAHAIDHVDSDARGRALAACSRALALDPDDTRARAILLRLLLTPPEQTPDTVEQELVESERDTIRANARGGFTAFGSFLAFVPVVAWMGLRDGLALGALVALIGAGMVVSFLGARARHPEIWAAPLSLALSTLALMVLSRLLGPFVLVPGLAMANAIGFSLESRGRRRIAYVIGAALAIVLPAALELAGIWPPSYDFRDGTLAILPRLTELPRTQTMVLLWSASLAAIVVPALLVSRTRDALRNAERRLAVAAWQLSQLVPQQKPAAPGRL